MKKGLILLTCLFLCISLYAYDFYVIRDTYLYDPSTSSKVTSIPKKSEIIIDRIGTGCVYRDGNHDEILYGVKITYNNFKGYIPLEDIILKNSMLIPDDLNFSEWIPAYELESLYSRNRKNLEDYVSFYKNYDKWRKYTDWDNDTWYSSHIPPRFIYINSVIRIESFNLFNGYIANIVTKNDDGKIAMQCVESENSGYDYDIPDYFTDIFLEGESYNLDYEIDGDYLYLTVNNQTKITLVRMRPGYSKVLFKFYVNTITEEDYKSIVWPRHADGSCDYDDKIIQNQKTSASYKTTDNLRLRRSEATTSEILTTLKKGTKVTVIKFGKQQTIDGVTAKWVKVQLDDGTEGWCFGGYLEPRP